MDDYLAKVARGVGAQIPNNTQNLTTPVNNNGGLGYQATPSTPLELVAPGTKPLIQDQLKFRVPLDFKQELIDGSSGKFVPLSKNSINTDRIYGVLKLNFNSSLSQVAFRLYVYNATNPQNKITSAHLHSGEANVNGPVVQFLFGGPAQNINGFLSKGVIDNNTIEVVSTNQPYNINTVSSLYQGIRKGLIYGNVHSEKFPGGVVRGQIYINSSGAVY